jgi:hypothetical protein
VDQGSLILGTDGNGNRILESFIPNILQAHLMCYNHMSNNYSVVLLVQILSDR